MEKPTRFNLTRRSHRLHISPRNVHSPERSRTVNVDGRLRLLAAARVVQRHPMCWSDIGGRYPTTENTRRKTMMKVLIAMCLATAAAAQDAKVTTLMTKELTGIAGKEGTMLTVEYAPGASSAEHRHNAHTFVYVLEGTVVMQVKGGKEVTLGPGQTFYESPA